MSSLRQLSLIVSIRSHLARSKSLPLNVLHQAHSPSLTIHSRHVVFETHKLAIN